MDDFDSELSGGGRDGLSTQDILMHLETCGESFETNPRVWASAGTSYIFSAGGDPKRVNDHLADGYDWANNSPRIIEDGKLESTSYSIKMKDPVTGKKRQSKVLSKVS